LLQRAFDLSPFGPDKTAAEGLFDHHYEIENQRVEHVIVESPLPVGPWRSVGHSHHAFFKESFVDELAHAAKVDPAEFRRRMLVSHPRHLAVLNAAVERAGKPEQSRAHGLALHACFGSIVAQVAEVSIEQGKPRVHKITCAIDCGTVINPEIVEQQIQSSIIMAMATQMRCSVWPSLSTNMPKTVHAPIDTNVGMDMKLVASVSLYLRPVCCNYKYKN
jgi:isoquinoline 1-oxidoreductase beta subunit